MIMHGHAYITEPPMAKFMDRGFRTLSYVMLVLFGLNQLMHHGGFIEGFWMSRDWLEILAMGLVTIGSISAGATAFGKAQVEYVTLPLIIALFGSMILFGISSMGWTPALSVAFSFWCHLCARYVWIHIAVRRARLVQRLSKGD